MTFSQLMASPSRHPFLSGTIAYLTGETVAFSGADAIAFSMSEGSAGGALLGGAFSASCSLTLCNRENAFSGVRTPYGAQVKVYLNEQDQRQPLCVFTVSKVVRQETDSALILSGADALGTAFEAPLEDDFSYPRTLYQLAAAIASQAGFTLNDDFPNAAVSIAARPDWGDLSLRQALAHVACAAGCFAYMDRGGALKLKPVKPSGNPFSIAPACTLRREYGEVVFGPLVGVSIALKGAPENTPPLTVQAAGATLTPFNSLAVSGNPLFSYGASHTQDLADGLYAALSNLTMAQAKITWQGDPTLTLGDAVQITDTAGDDTVTLVTHQTLTFSQGFSMQSDCAAQASAAAVGRLFTADGALNAAKLSGSLDGSLLRAGTVAASSLIAGSVTAQQIAAGAVTADKIAANAVTAGKIAAGAVESGHLSADALSAVDARIQSANIDWAAITNLSAATAAIADARIAAADIDWAHIKDLASDTAIITQGVGGKLYIARLSVTEANLVSLTVGELLVKGQDGGFYAVQVNGQGQIVTQRKQVVNADVTDLSINADTKLIEGSVTAKTLNAQDIFADTALIRQLIAANLDVDTLFARNATVTALNAVDISGNSSLRLYVAGAVGPVENRLTTAESAILQKADSIDLTVLQTQVDDLSVGARNLLPGGGPERTAPRLLTVPVRDALSPYVGQSLCVSFEAKGTVARDVNVFAYESAGISIGSGFAFEMPTDDFHRFSFVTSVRNYGEREGLTSGAIAFCDFTGEQNMIIRKIKLELGNLPTDWTPAPEDAVETVDNAAVRIDPTGVTMRGGVMDFEAGSAFSVTSGGTFNVFAADDASAIKFGGTAANPNFSLGSGGTVKAASITTDHLTVKDTDLVSALTGSLANRLIVSDTLPSGHGILWFQPSAVSSVDFILDHSGGEDMSGLTKSRTLTGFLRQGSALMGNTCTYGVKFSIYNYQGACQWTQVLVQIQRADGTGNTLTIYDASPNVHVGVGDYFSVNTLLTPSAALENITDGSAIAVTVTIQKSASTYARFEVNQNFILRCANSSSQSAQTCNIRYIP